jgi:hypothetical protein
MARAKQYADRVNVIKRIKAGTKWPFAPVVERNGRIVRDHVWIRGHDEYHPEGRITLSGIRTAGVAAKRLAPSILSSKQRAPNRLSSMR